MLFKDRQTDLLLGVCLAAWAEAMPGDEGKHMGLTGRRRGLVLTPGSPGASDLGRPQPALLPGAPTVLRSATSVVTGLVVHVLSKPRLWWEEPAHGRGR